MERENPCLRADLEFIPIEDQGRKLIAVRDPLGLTPDGTAIPAEGFGLIGMLDGTRTREELLEELQKQAGEQQFSMKHLMDILDQLDSVYLLYSKRFAIQWRELVDEFSQQKVRTASLGGRGYPEDPEELKVFLEDIVTTPREEHTKPPDGPIKGIVAPHIDPGVAKLVYAASYNLVRKIAAPKRVVLLGVGHAMPQGLFATTTKAFETPLGLTANDEFASMALTRAGAGAMALNEFAHKTEHSIEFQLIFLQHLLGPDAFTIVPVLCGAPSLNLQDYSRKAFLQKAGGFLDALRELVADPDTLILAGVDLSHVGSKFGHDKPARDMEEDAIAHDQRLLKALTEPDADALWAESARVEDRYNVCGFSALATLIEVLPPGEGVLVDYSMWHEDPTHSAVSFASCAFSA